MFACGCGLLLNSFQSIVIIISSAELAMPEALFWHSDHDQRPFSTDQQRNS